MARLDLTEDDESDVLDAIGSARRRLDYFHMLRRTGAPPVIVRHEEFLAERAIRASIAVLQRIAQRLGGTPRQVLFSLRWTDEQWCVDLWYAEDDATPQEIKDAERDKRTARREHRAQIKCAIRLVLRALPEPGVVDRLGRVVGPGVELDEGAEVADG